MARNELTSLASRLVLRVTCSRHVLPSRASDIHCETFSIFEQKVDLGLLVDRYIAQEVYDGFRCALELFH